MSNILISGGSGMIGKRLTALLRGKGYSVSILSRSKRTIPGVTSYRWDVNKGSIDQEAIEKADHIIHLAGTGIADKRWTDQRKKEIHDSRILSTRLLVDQLNKQNHQVKSFISTSAVGIYGDSGDQIMKEGDRPADDFLAKVCEDWEREAKIENQKSKTRQGVRLVIPRIGIVLSREGGALPELDKTTNFGFASYLGSGKQYYSWIHIDDLCNMLIYMMETDTITGTYNAVAPNPVTNKELVKKIVKARNKTAAIVPAPEFALRIILGEMADMILKTQRCSADKIIGDGFRFSFETVEEALEDLY